MSHDEIARTLHGAARLLWQMRNGESKWRSRGYDRGYNDAMDLLLDMADWHDMLGRLPTRQI